ncbi:MAG: LON peptidase substrate-binding domain-containing protein [Bacteroidota bacterium]
MPKETIGLFPLKLVLFPESFFPLHIFENKFIELINNNIVYKTPFGINLRVASRTYDVGCLTEVINITKKYDDGRMDIVVLGLSRYKIYNIRIGESGYSIGDAEPYEDIPDIINPALLLKCIETFNLISDTVTSVKIEKIFTANLKTSIPSFLIAQKAGLSNIQKQELLESKSENERLYMLLKHLENILPIVRDSEFSANLIKNDGYIQSKQFPK